MINDASLVMIPSGYKDGKLYSVKPTNGDGDFTFSRGSNLAATRVNSEGLIEKGRENLLFYSQDFSDSNWVLQNNATITHNITDPNGGTTASRLSFDALTNSGLYQQQLTNFGTGLIRTASIYLKGTVGGENVMIGDASNRTRVVLTTDWVRYEGFASDDSTFFIIYTDHISGASSDIIDIAFAQYELGLVATDYIETTTTTAQAGILEDMPRLDYSGGSCPALLLEPQRSNLFPQSEYFGGWDVYRGSLTANDTTSPEGVDNAYRYEENSDTGQHFVRKTISMTSGTTYTASAFVKADEITSVKLGSSNTGNWNASATFNLSNGSVSSGSGIIENYGNRWYRCIVTAACTTTATIGLEITTSSGAGSLGDGLYIYGAMIEQGSYPTSYIPTYGSSVTRSQDVPSIVNLQSKGLFGSTSGSIFYEFENVQDLFKGWSISNTKDRYQYVDIGGSANGYFRFRGYEQSFNLQVVNLGATSTISVGSTTKKLCITWDANGFSLYGDGVLLGSISITDSIAVNSISNYNGNLSNTGDLLREMIWFPTRLTDAEAIALTTI